MSRVTNRRLPVWIFEIPYWPVLPKFESDIGTIQVTIAGMIRYTETMSNKDCKNPSRLNDKKSF
uniref:Uncharacterized protein n=1 Tax=Klebsiella pneumoniae TaxID=573 RepID=A0A8B0SPD3_KLEPN|nr:hypothetical protein [Klebsiella pneumoniae]